jgi:hypothetical protein
VQGYPKRWQESGYELSRGWEAAVLDGCSSGWTRVDTGRRGLHGKGVINVVGLCSTESLRGYGGVYPDIDKVVMQELYALEERGLNRVTGEQEHNSLA